MTCEKFHEIITTVNVLDTSSDLRQEMLRHIVICPHCQDDYKREKPINDGEKAKEIIDMAHADIARYLGTNN